MKERHHARSVVFSISLVPLIFAATSILAQTVEQQKAQIAANMQAELEVHCAEFVPGLFEDGDLRPALAIRPIDTKAVCSCAVKSMHRENRLVKMIEADQPLPEPRTEVLRKQINSYMLLLYLQSMYGCLAADMERSSKTSPIGR